MSKAEDAIKEAIEQKKTTDLHEQARLTAHKVRELAPPFPRFIAYEGKEHRLALGGEGPGAIVPPTRSH